MVEFYRELQHIWMDRNNHIGNYIKNSVTIFRSNLEHGIWVLASDTIAEKIWLYFISMAHLNTSHLFPTSVGCQCLEPLQHTCCHPSSERRTLFSFIIRYIEWFYIFPLLKPLQGRWESKWRFGTLARVCTTTSQLPGVKSRKEKKKSARAQTFVQ